MHLTHPMNYLNPAFRQHYCEKHEIKHEHAVCPHCEREDEEAAADMDLWQSIMCAESPKGVREW